MGGIGNLGDRALRRKQEKGHSIQRRKRIRWNLTPIGKDAMRLVSAFLLALASMACLPNRSLAQDFESILRAERLEALAAESRKSGDAARGAIIFHQPFMACTRCHAAGDGKVLPLGPDLTTIDKATTDASLVESVLWPSKVIRKGYESATVSTTSGKILTGILQSQGPAGVVIRDPAKGGEATTIPKADIAEFAMTPTSVMPTGLTNQLSSRQQFLDLARYLMELRDGGAPRALALRPPANLISPEPPEYEKRIDHAGMLRSLDGKALARGEAIYRRVCANCHGTLEMAGSLPAAPRFAESALKNGNDPFAMYQTLTRGFGLMPAQTWMVPSQKYEVIHYIRETYLRPKARLTPLDDRYLAGLPKGDTKGPEPTKIEPWSAMDYGPTLTHTYEIPGRDRNFAHKGIASRLDSGPGGVARGGRWAVFDEDTMRIAAVWEVPPGEKKAGSDSRFIDWRGIQFNGEHGIHPRLSGLVRLANGTGPGWANPADGSWDDSSARIRGRDGNPYGPLPRSWARFQGLYHHGQQAVFSYTVGDTPVLESPRSFPSSEPTAGEVFARLLVVGPRSRDLELQVAEHLDPNAGLTKGAGDSVILASPRGAPGHAMFRFDGESHLEVADASPFDMTGKPFTIVARMKTTEGGTLFAKAAPGAGWTPGGQALFVRGGKLVFDIGWVGAVTSKASVHDGKWHVVAAVADPARGAVSLFIDGKADTTGTLRARPGPAGAVARIGFGAPNFPSPSRFKGDIADIRFYQQILAPGDYTTGDRMPEKAGALAQWNPGEVQGQLVANDKTGNKRDAAVSRGNGSAAAGGAVIAGGYPESGSLLWKSSNGKLRLTIPAGAEPVRFCVWSATRPLDEDKQASPVPVISASDLNLEALTKGGAARWPQVLETPIAKGMEDGPFATDTLTAPEANPWLAQTRFTGLDFMPDGRIVVCSWDGDVWMVENTGSNLKWRRIASGMFQPLGIKVISGKIHVTCRDQLTILHDLNGDGETDFYQCLNSDHQVTEHFHEFAMGLQTDKAGNFYYAKSARHALPAVVPHHGTLLKVSADGSRTEIIANGFRAANGVCLNPDGSFVVTDQEGHWNPKNRINWVRPPDAGSDGKPRFYGNMFGYHDRTDSSDSAMEPPLCWITNAFDRSPAELLWVESPSWGPLNGGLLNLSYGYGKVFLVPHEKTAGGNPQGGMVELPIPSFPTGVMRGRFNPADGHLYLCGMFAWAGNATKPGGFYRIRATGQPARLPKGLKATTEGVEITFSDPVDPRSVSADKAQVRVWGLRRSANYGSPHVNEHPLAVKEATVGADGRTVRLRVEGMAPTWGMEIAYSFAGTDGKPVAGRIHNTVHALAGGSKP